MQSQNTFSNSFFLRKDKSKDGNTPSLARITVNGDFKNSSCAGNFAYTI
jgi:hypothetical protein